MDSQQVFTFGQQSLYMLLMISAPILLTVLAVGLVVSIFQAATQIHKAGNDSDVDLFSEFAHKPKPATWSDVSTTTLVPAFMLSELKTAFLLGFQVYLPFLVIDMVISIVLISMGMMMLPPALISLPFKLLLFVLVDGWHLITQSLMGSFVGG
jgi:flagellar biosynthetic protein FliP